jgi:hypothetical protein
LKFFEEVFSLEFDSTPNYNYLRGLLIGMEEKAKSVPNKSKDFMALNKKKARSQIVTMSQYCPFKISEIFTS